MASDASPVRSSAFSFERPVLLRPRLYLYTDRLELRGWRWLERYRRIISFREILQVDVADGTLVVWLDDGTTLRLCVDAAADWKTAVDARL
jgi:hypothetical protein